MRFHGENKRPSWLKREAMEQHSIDMRQFADFRHSTLPNGMRIIEVYNSSGLTFTILPDRGLDIWTAHYKGIPLTWISQGSPHPPDFGQSWLQQFNGGLLTTCGLTHVGPPETDSETGEHRDIHGRYSRLRTERICTQSEWGSDNYQLELSGTVSQTRLFAEQLRVTRTYRLALGDPTIHISDIVTNVGDTPTPFMILYHFNLGFPLVADGTKLHIAHEAVYPRDEEARSGFDTWFKYDAATPRFAEQVFFHHAKSDEEGQAMAALLQDDFGLALEWDTTSLPYFTQWKNTRQGIYVNGIEPSNCIPEGQKAARENGRLVMIEPGETRVFSCKMEVLDGEMQVKECAKYISALQQNGKPAAGCKLNDFSSVVE
jgi:galactose mutarotase-like enzyme